MDKMTIIMIFLFLSVNCLAENLTIYNYQPIFSTVADNTGKKFIALRSFALQSDLSYLVVDPLTLKTSIVPQHSMQHMDTNDKEKETGSNYLTALRRYTSAPWVLQNQGINRAETPSSHSAFMTVDLCPSSRDFDKNFFIKLMANNQPAPFPVAIAVSGLWILRHEKAFQWLQAQRKNNYLDIVWVNHTYHHYYIPGRSNDDNFLLLPGTNIRQEILLNEQLLISRKEIPSIFIRFPGLISNQRVVETSRQLGLIPLAADAWLAKSQKIHAGSVVLVHGNGNEPLGLRLLTEDVLSNTTWLPLYLSVENL